MTNDLNRIDINGVYNTTEMKDVPQGLDGAELVLFLVKELQCEGYRGVRLSTEDSTIYYKDSPHTKPAHGYYVQERGQTVATYVRLAQEI